MDDIIQKRPIKRPPNKRPPHMTQSGGQKVFQKGNHNKNPQEEKKDRVISWQAPEYEYHPKSVDWYWVVGIVSLGLFLEDGTPLLLF